MILESIKQGDEVVIRGGTMLSYWTDSYSIVNVVRVTETMIVCAGKANKAEVRFSRKSGKMIGSADSYNGSEIYTNITVQEAMKIIGKRNAIRSIQKTFSDIKTIESLEESDLRTIYEIVKKAKDKK